MQHVQEIRQLIQRGKAHEARSALENLLELGPNNLAALKLKAHLLAHEAKFAEEQQVWEKILGLDAEDLDAMVYLHSRLLEEQEKLYFTDELPYGARRFIAHPRLLVFASILGMLGCAGFMIMNRLSFLQPWMQLPAYGFLSFGILVGIPWVFLMVQYFRGLREIVLTQDGILFFTRLKTVEVLWKDLDQAVVTPSKEGGMVLHLIPKEPEGSWVEINLTPSTSVLKARKFFLGEIKRYFQEPVFQQNTQAPEKKISY